MTMVGFLLQKARRGDIGAALAASDWFQENGQPHVASYWRIAARDFEVTRKHGQVVVIASNRRHAVVDLTHLYQGTWKYVCRAHDLLGRGSHEKPCLICLLVPQTDILRRDEHLYHQMRHNIGCGHATTIEKPPIGKGWSDMLEAALKDHKEYVDRAWA